MHLICTHLYVSGATMTSSYILTPGATYDVPIYPNTQSVGLRVAGTTPADGLVEALDRQTDRLGSILDGLVTELAFQRNRADVLERILDGSR